MFLYTTNNITHNDSLYTTSFLSNTTINPLNPYIVKSPSKKKLKEIAINLKNDSDIIKNRNQKTNNHNQTPITLCNSNINNEYQKHISILNNTNKLIRISSLGPLQFKRTSSLENLIIGTETKSNLRNRSNSKILRDITFINNELQGKQKTISNKYNIKNYERTFLNSNPLKNNNIKDIPRKNYFKITSLLINQSNINNRLNHQKYPNYSNKMLYNDYGTYNHFKIQKTLLNIINI